MKNQYEIICNQTGKVVFTGDGKACGDWLGKSSDCVRAAARRGINISGKQYRVRCLNDNRDLISEAEAIKQWDDFVTPIRQRFGIPVYKAKPEVRE